MALVKCPECGNEVSSTARQCVHCGFSFVVCPDCGEILSDGVTVCPNCGCALEKVAASQSEKQPATQSDGLSKAADVAVSSEWDNRCAEQKRKGKIVKRMNKALDIVGTLFIVVASIILFNWADKESLERFEAFKSVLRAVPLLTLFGGILWTASITVDIIDGAILPYLFYKKALKEKLDIKGFLKEHENDIGTEEFVNSFNACVTAAYWGDERKACLWEFARLMIAAVLNVACGICILIFVFRIEVSYIMAWRIDQPFSWSEISFDVIIAAGVLFVLELIVLSVLYFINDGRRDRWIEKFFADGQPKK